MTIELNKAALDAAQSAALELRLNYSTNAVVKIAIEKYLEVIEEQKKPKPIPFDPAKVKQGDSLLVNGTIPAKFIAVYNHNVIVDMMYDVDNVEDWLSAYGRTSVTIPPQPPTELRVYLDSRQSYTVVTDSQSVNAGWKLIGTVAFSSKVPE